MKHSYRKALVTGVIATLVFAPGWAIANTGQTRGAQDPAQSGNTMQEQQTQPMTISSQGVYGKTPQDLHGMEVRGTNGEALGTLKEIVAKREDRQVYAVLSVGGILGVGAKEIVVPLEQLQLRGDQLHILSTKDHLMKGETYAATQYRRVEPEDRPISEFSAFEAMPEGSTK